MIKSHILKLRKKTASPKVGIASKKSTKPLYQEKKVEEEKLKVSRTSMPTASSKP